MKKHTVRHLDKGRFDQNKLIGLISILFLKKRDKKQSFFSAIPYSL